MAAYTHALLWYITQDVSHAEKAMEIMDGWSAIFREQESAKSAGLVAGWVGSLWPLAAEIIRHTYHGWPASSVARFEHMLTSIYLPLVERGSDTNGEPAILLHSWAALV